MILSASSGCNKKSAILASRRVEIHHIVPGVVSAQREKAAFLLDEQDYQYAPDLTK